MRPTSGRAPPTTAPTAPPTPRARRPASRRPPARSEPRRLQPPSAGTRQRHRDRPRAPAAEPPDRRVARAAAEEDRAAEQGARARRRARQAPVHRGEATILTGRPLVYTNRLQSPQTGASPPSGRSSAEGNAPLSFRQSPCDPHPPPAIVLTAMSRSPRARGRPALGAKSCGRQMIDDWYDRTAASTAVRPALLRGGDRRAPGRRRAVLERPGRHRARARASGGQGPAGGRRRRARPGRHDRRREVPPPPPATDDTSNTTTEPRDEGETPEALPDGTTTSNADFPCRCR